MVCKKTLSSTHVALVPMSSYPTELLVMTTTTTTVQLNKLLSTTIKFRIIDGTIRFKNDNNKHTRLVQYVSVVTLSNDTLTFYFRFEMPNIYYC